MIDKHVMRLNLQHCVSVMSIMKSYSTELS